MTELDPTYAPGVVGHTGVAGFGWTTGRCAAAGGVLIDDPVIGFRFIANLFGGKFRAKYTIRPSIASQFAALTSIILSHKPPSRRLASCRPSTASHFDFFHSCSRCSQSTL